MVYRILLWVFLIIPADWKKVANTNAALTRAEKSYKEADYENSVRYHLSLLEDHQLDNPEVRFNLALSYQNNGQEEDAKKTYEPLISGKDHTIPSFAANQQGVLLGNEKKYQEALSYFKTALLKDPGNEQARYNYELLARWLDGNEENQENEEDREEEDQIQPSNYAKRMKAQADEMVDRFRFEEASEIMDSALEIDETVAHYQKFMDHLKEINEINENL